MKRKNGFLKRAKLRKNRATEGSMPAKYCQYIQWYAKLNTVISEKH
jgi:hypothetical protein